MRRSLDKTDALICSQLHAEAGYQPLWSSHEYEALLSLSTTWSVGLFGADNTLKGFILAQIVSPEADVLMIIVSPTHQRQGHGTVLLQALETASELKTILLDVNATNTAAQNLYKKCGFIEIGYRPRYYTIGTNTYDALLFKKEIK